MNHNQAVGRFGESAAKNFLEKRGYKIIDMNVKFRREEIDIVASCGNVLVFIEVKARCSNRFGESWEAATGVKIGKLKRAINLYLLKNNSDFNLIRLDLVAVDIDRAKKTAKIRHFKDIS